MEGRDGKADLHRRHTIDFSSNPSSGAGASSGTKGQEGGGGGGRRKARLWIGLGVLLVLSIGGIVVWAIARSKGPSAVGSCAKAPAFPKDRRKDKDRITLVNFNAEWLFLRGGTGQIVCPSQSCPWAVRVCPCADG